MAKDRDAKSLWIAVSKVSYIGIFFGVAIFIGFFFGRWLDARWQTTPWLSIVGLLVGVAAGFRELVRVAIRLRKDEEKMP